MDSASAGVASIGNQVIVVEVDAVRADFAEQVDQFSRGLVRAHRRPEWVCATVADRPQAEGEFVFGEW